LVADVSLRSDARRNRERILAAAEEVFLERGAGVSLEDVARRAGVGIGTLYRRFPTREDLLAAAYSARFLAFAETSRARSAEMDPLGALRAYLEELVRYSNLYRGFAASLGTVLRIGTEGCLATTEEGVRLLAEAQSSGAIRPEIGFDDVVCVVTAVSLATERDPSPEGRIARLLSMFVDGLVADRRCRDHDAAATP